MPTYTQYMKTLTADTGAGPSESIWANCPILEMTHDPGVGYHFFDDFVHGITDTVVTTAAYHAPYDMFAESGSTFLSVPDYPGGEMDFVAAGTANSNCTITLGTGAAFVISDTSSAARKLWFECRIRMNTIANDVSSIFVGMGQEGLTAADSVLTLTGGSTIDSAWGNSDLIGFWRGDDDGDGVNFGYGKNGQTAQEVKADIHTLVADAFVKLGFVYDPAAVADERITLYVNGTKQTTFVTATNIAASTFPDGEELTLVASIMNDDGSTTSSLGMDWWRAAQLR